MARRCASRRPTATVTLTVPSAPILTATGLGLSLGFVNGCDRLNLAEPAVLGGHV